MRIRARHLSLVSVLGAFLTGTIVAIGWLVLDGGPDAFRVILAVSIVLAVTTGIALAAQMKHAVMMRSEVISHLRQHIGSLDQRMDDRQGAINDSLDSRLDVMRTELTITQHDVNRLMAVALELTDLFSEHHRLSEQYLRNAAVTQTQDVEEILATVRILVGGNFGSVVPRPGGYAVTAASAAYIFDEMRMQKPEHVVEAGSGFSSLVVARALAQQGYGHLTIFEHEEGFAEETEIALNSAGLSGYASVLYRPLSSNSDDEDSNPWYSISADDLPDRIDALIVDGPPGWSAPLARYPAVPRLIDRMPHGSRVFLDDTNRPDEKAILERWTSHWPLKVIDSNSGGHGLAVLSVSRDEP